MTACKPGGNSCSRITFGLRPVTIWYTVAARLQRSLRSSTSAASRRCSGGMKSSVPSTAPVIVCPWSEASAFASPKSVSFGTPSAESSTFAGLMSR